jgi:ABC-type uncharacterized transport system permease subunit
MKIGFNTRVVICTVELVLLVFLEVLGVYIVFNHTQFPDIAVMMAIVNVSATLWLSLGLLHFSEPWIEESMISMEAVNVPG